MGRPERRKYTRLPIKLALSYRKAGATAGRSHRGCTLNASPGGLCFHTTAGILKSSNLLQLELSIPPTAGILEFGGRISGLAKVLRTENMQALGSKSGATSSGQRVAVQFCHRPTLCM